jgi:hypothetical protein
VDRVHSAGAQVHGTLLNVSHSSGDLRPGLNEPKRYPTFLILDIDAGMDGPRRLGRSGRNVWPGVVAQRSRPLPVLRCTNHDGRKGKTERGSRGCSPRVAKGLARGGCGLGWLLLAWVRRWLNAGAFRLQEGDGNLLSDVLVLLPASIAVSGDELVAHDGG